MITFTQSPHDLRRQALTAKSPQQADDLNRKAGNIENQLFNDPARIRLCEEHRAFRTIITLDNCPPFARMVWGPRNRSA